MSHKNYLGYHACSQEGGYKGVRAGIPFFAPHTEDRTQWLSPGYYFWTDSALYAKSWMPKKRNAGKAIGEFNIFLDDSAEAEELLDLVGNVAHQEQFIELVEIVLEQLPQTNITDVLVNEVISLLREENEAEPGMFPYIAIKAMDNRKKSRDMIHLGFVPKEENNLKLPLLTPQQMCLFDASRVRLTKFVEPEEYQKHFEEENR
ncbi:hypothetical protein [Moritella marina]|uniref:hypothetical protein n=1 Tax=Moritella marina TaxID=90736 RepID=UPI003703875C